MNLMQKLFRGRAPKILPPKILPRIVILLSLAFVGLGVVAVGTLGGGIKTAMALEIGKLNPAPRDLPAFSLSDLDGKNWTPSDVIGKPVIVNFWATWCGPCRKEMPSLNRAWKLVEDEGIGMLAINLGDPKSSIENFMSKVPIDFPVLLSTNPSDLQDWGIRGLPTTLVLDLDGSIVLELVGPAEWDEDELLDQVRELLPKTSTQ